MQTQKREPTKPGEILYRHHIVPMGLTITETAQTLGVSRKAVSAIVNGRKSITPDMALKLSRHFDTTPELWLNMQANHDLWCARRRAEGTNKK